MDTLLQSIKKIIPKKLFYSLQPTYHRTIAFLGAVIYGFPSRDIKVIFITGTKGKSSTTEILNAVLEAGGKKTALANTIRFKIDSYSWRNTFKMTTPGRFFLQRFLRKAVNAGCTHAVIEMSSQAAIQFRHTHIDFDALLFLNISPEHIESHGGFDNYLKAKLSLARALASSSKRPRTIVVNADDPESHKFLAIDAEQKMEFSLKDAEPYILDHFGLYMTYKGKNLRSSLQGTFNIYNILAALTYASLEGMTPEQAQVGLSKLNMIPGRVQKITLPESNPLAVKQKFNVVVDYAHTADSLEKIYSVFNDSRKICVLGNTGGGRDTWKRPAMAKVANDNCSHVILTNEDPYNEDPQTIIADMLPSITSVPHEVIMDRRQAIHRALSLARAGDSVIITGKGTDPYIMEANNKKVPWSDAVVAEEELEKVLAESK